MPVLSKLRHAVRKIFGIFISIYDKVQVWLDPEESDGDPLLSDFESTTVYGTDDENHELYHVTDTLTEEGIFDFSPHLPSGM
jgi:hypothetical protein